jgi:hypothetical protein
MKQKCNLHTDTKFNPEGQKDYNLTIFSIINEFIKESFQLLFQLPSHIMSLPFQLKAGSDYVEHDGLESNIFEMTGKNKIIYPVMICNN